MTFELGEQMILYMMKLELTLNLFLLALSREFILIQLYIHLEVNRTGKRS